MPKGKYFVGDLPLFIKEGVINWDEIKDGKHDEIMAFVGILPHFDGEQVYVCGTARTGIIGCVMVDNNEKCGKIELGGACFGFIVDFPKDFICSIDYENEMFVFGDEFEVDVSEEGKWENQFDSEDDNEA